jgi:hypothetical protein
MAQIKDMQTGADSDGFVVGGTFTASGAVVLSGSATATISAPLVMSGTVTMNGNNNIGNTTSSTILSGTVTQTTSSKLYLDTAATTASAPSLSWSSDNTTGIYRPGSGIIAVSTGGTERVRVTSTGLVLGSGDATATTSSTILRAPNASGTNITGANFEIDAGNGTGTGGSGGIIIKTAAAGSSGSTANTLTQRLYVTPNGGISFGSTTTAYGSTGQVLKSNGDAPPSFGTTLTVSSSTSLSSTYTDITGIPSWAKRVTVIVNSAVPSAAVVPAMQLITGTNTVVSSGYVGSATSVASGSTGAVATSSSKFNLGFSSNNWTFSEVIQLINISGNVWVINNNGSRVLSGSVVSDQATGSVDAGAVLTGIRITTISGTATFSSGTVNIIYE